MELLAKNLAKRYMNSLLNNETFLAGVAVTGFVCMFTALIAIGLSLTIGFRKCVEIEKLAGAPGKEMRTMARVYGDHVVGRTVRGAVVGSFLIYRRFPGWGARRAAKLGDIEVDIPARLERWVIIPQAIGFSATALGILLSQLL
ncbi:hypothetical protein [Marinobacter fonticola]|uniref:hypothetical protein n=1 Tax=Marinobacter fonticola TaxID=2603215 RepID=UPI0011E70071|nr:hypothetical protein [Marinobacter fonticola]